MIVRIAEGHEIENLLNLWIEKSRWLMERKQALWREDQFTIENLQRQYQDPEYYVCCDAGQIVGAFILIEKDNRYWPEKTEDDSLYLHKLMVCNGCNGKGYGGEILDWVKDFCRQQGRSYVRLDYDHNRKSIEEFYLRNGFVKTEIVTNTENKSMAKAEFRIFKYMTV